MSDIDLKPCPFCGGDAEIVHIDDGENEGGSCVSCSRCLASSNVEFEFKENFVSNWNRRTEVDIITSLRTELERKDAALLVLSDHFIHGYGDNTRGGVIRAVETIARAALSQHRRKRKHD